VLSAADAAPQASGRLCSALQVQLLASDFVPLDRERIVLATANSDQAVGGVHGFGPRGSCTGCTGQHPGASFNVMGTVTSLVRVPASEVLHNLFEGDRAWPQVRGARLAAGA